MEHPSIIRVVRAIFGSHLPCLLRRLISRGAPDVVVTRGATTGGGTRQAAESVWHLTTRSSLLLVGTVVERRTLAAGPCASERPSICFNVRGRDGNSVTSVVTDPACAPEVGMRWAIPVKVGREGMLWEAPPTWTAVQ